MCKSLHSIYRIQTHRHFGQPLALGIDDLKVASSIMVFLYATGNFISSVVGDETRVDE